MCADTPTVSTDYAAASIYPVAIEAECSEDELIARAADVCLKERRRVVLMFRETPLHAGHIRALDQASRNGAIIMPPVPAFYNRPETLEDMIDQTVGRALDLFDLDPGIVKRWQG